MFTSESSAKILNLFTAKPQSNSFANLNYFFPSHNNHLFVTGINNDSTATV